MDYVWYTHLFSFLSSTSFYPSPLWLSTDMWERASTLLTGFSFSKSALMLLAPGRCKFQSFLCMSAWTAWRNIYLPWYPSHSTDFLIICEFKITFHTAKKRSLHAEWMWIGFLVAVNHSVVCYEPSHRSNESQLSSILINKNTLHRREVVYSLFKTI